MKITAHKIFLEKSDFGTMLLKPWKKNICITDDCSRILYKLPSSNPGFNSIINGRYMHAELSQFRRHSISWQVDEQLKNK